MTALELIVHLLPALVVGALTFVAVVVPAWLLYWHRWAERHARRRGRR